MKSVTAQRTELSQKTMERLEQIFTEAGIEYYRTGENLNTITFEAGEVEGPLKNKETGKSTNCRRVLYGSIKFTLHKDDYNLDEEIENFELFYEDKERNKKEKELREARVEKERKLREEKVAEKIRLTEKKREKARAELAALRQKETESEPEEVTAPEAE